MSNNISFIRIWEGSHIIIDAIQIDRKCPFKNFERELTDKESKKLYALFHLLDIKKGNITNNQKLKKLYLTCESCFELKSGKQERISFIYLKQLYNGVYNHICLLDGFKKKQDKWPKREIEKTKKLCKKAREYENNKGGANV